MNERDYYLKKARRTNAEADWQLYRHSRNSVTYTIGQPKDFWKNIKRFYPTKQKSHDLPPMMKVNGKRTLDKTSIANSTIGLSLQNQTISLRNRVWKTFDNRRIGKLNNVTSTFHFKPTNPRLIEKLLRSLKISKATGPDNIPALILKDTELAVPLCYLINISMDTGNLNEKNNEKKS